MNRTRGSDPVLSRIERDAARAGVAIAVLAALVSRHWNPPLAVLGGALLSAISYRGIKAGTEALTAAAARSADGEDAAPATPAIAWRLVKFFTRFAILTAAAYVMMVRFRLHPGWIIAGASALVVAIGAEAIRVARDTHGPRRAA